MANELRRRENVAGMDSSHPMLSSYAEAVQRMKDLPQSDPRNWERQAQIHFDGCPHGNWYFLPWHRAYVLEFEEICQEMSGNPDFALPYWNWTQNNSIPGPFWQGTLLDTTREIGPTASISVLFVRQRLIDALLREVDFELFASFKPVGQNNTDQNWQRVPGGGALLERTPHDAVHVWIGGQSGNMRTLMSPRDPIFWLHHCNIDRLWAEWNAPPLGHGNTSDAHWTDFRLSPFNKVVGDLQDITQLQYTYDTLAQPQPVQPSPLPPLLDRATNRFELMEPRVASLGREVSFAVETPQSALPLAAEAVSTEDGAVEGGPKVLAFVRGVEEPQDPQVTVNVFLNCPYLSTETPVSDPHYVGNFTFFGFHGDHGGGDHHEEHDDHGIDDAHAEGGHNTKSFAFDLTKIVDRLGTQESDLESRLTVQLLPVPFEGRDVPHEEIKIAGVEIVYV
jgi:tyrosinase